MCTAPVGAVMGSPRGADVELIRPVLPRHVNARGTLYGGWMMHWLVDAGSVAATRVARGPAVLGYLDDLFFIRPVPPGSILSYRATVEYVGRSSMAVRVDCWIEDAETGERSLATVARMAFVSVDSRGRPRPVPNPNAIPRGGEAWEAARGWLEEVRRRVSDRAERALDVGMEGFGLRSVRVVRPDAAVYGDMMYAGSLLLEMDGFAAAAAALHAGGRVVTASLDHMAFYWPIRVGDVLTMAARLNYTGRTSMEVEVKVVTERPGESPARHCTTAYFTLVHVDEGGRPKPVPPLIPGDEEARLRWEEAARRKERRLKVLAEMKRLAGGAGGGPR